jgi:hypothetical protein
MNNIQVIKIILKYNAPNFKIQHLNSFYRSTYLKFDDGIEANYDSSTDGWGFF